MRLTGRGGMTLVELLVGAVLTNGLFLLAFGSLGQMQRTLQRAAVKSASWAGLAGGVQLLRRDLSEVGPTDVLVMEPERIIYRAWRGSGLSCGRSVDGILLRSTRFRGLRLPSPGRDSLSVFHRNKVAGSSWDPLPITGPPRTGGCPDGSPALVVPTPITDSLPTPAPVRFFEIMEIRLYQSGGRWWVGARSVSNAESIQPVVGPFAAGGLEFAFLDASGASVTDPLALNRITARLISAMDDRDALAGAVSGGAGRMDSLRTTAQVPWEF